MSYATMLENMDAERIGPHAVEELKQVRFLEGVLDGKTGAIAARDAGYGVAAQRVPGKLLESPELRRRFQEVAEKKGITLERVAEKLAQHMDARLVVSFEGAAAVTAAPDYRAQAKAVDQFTELVGLRDGAKAGNVSATQINITLNGALAEAMAKRMSGE